MPLSQFEVDLLSGMIAKATGVLTFEGDRLDAIKYGIRAALKAVAPAVTLDAKFQPLPKTPPSPPAPGRRRDPSSRRRARPASPASPRPAPSPAPPPQP